MRELKTNEMKVVSGGCPGTSIQHGPLFHTLSEEEQAEICAELAGQPDGSFTTTTVDGYSFTGNGTTTFGSTNAWGFSQPR